MIVAPGASLLLTVDDPSRVAEARRLAAGLARKLGFASSALGQVGLVVTEAATNLVKHGGGGLILARAVGVTGVAGVELLALDRGPGMADVARCLIDGHSTAGSPGNGLGAIHRIADLFEVYSVPGQGTALLARLWAGPRPKVAPGFEAGAACVALAGEIECGDAWALARRPGGATLLVADGLGHGPQAASAAQAAVAAFASVAEKSPATILQALHDALRATRGAAIAIARIESALGRLTYAGVGNIAGHIHCAGGSVGLVSLSGTVGHELRKVKEFDHPWSPGATLVMHSDGLGTRWDLEAYPGLASRHPALAAGVLFRDFRRNRDDVTVVVAREMRSPGTL